MVKAGNAIQGDSLHLLALSLIKDRAATLMSHYKALCTAQVDLFLKTQGICTIAATTTSRVNHLLSAGTTNQGACFDAVARIASSNAFM